MTSCCQSYCATTCVWDLNFFLYVIASTCTHGTCLVAVCVYACVHLCSCVSVCIQWMCLWAVCISRKIIRVLYITKILWINGPNTRVWVCIRVCSARHIKLYVLYMIIGKKAKHMYMRERARVSGATMRVRVYLQHRFWLKQEVATAETCLHVLMEKTLPIPDLRGEMKKRFSFSRNESKKLLFPSPSVVTEVLALMFLSS